MTRYRVLLSVTITLLVSVVTAPSTLAFNDTNSVLGIVYVPKGDVTVEVFGRSSINDTTNGEGLYCLLVSKGIPSFQLTYTARGYWSQTSRKTYQNNQQRQKIEGVHLRPKQVSDVSNFGVLKDLLGETLSVWQEAQPDTKKLIVSDLIAFREEVARTAGIPAQDRQRGVMAINETLSRMGASVPAAALVQSYALKVIDGLVSGQG